MSDVKSVIGIPTINRADLLEEALDLYSKNWKRNIFIVDNGSQIIQPRPLVKVMKMSHNLGVSGSWNHLCKTLFSQGYTHVCLLNDDVIWKKTQDQIDKFINEMVMRVELRREKLKNDYSLIETREKRRLKNKQIKLQKELDLLDEFKEDFDKFIDDFDLEMDYQANQASFENTYKQSYIEMLQEKINRRSDNDIFSRSEFIMPTF
jgi:hypothetical protein